MWETIAAEASAESSLWQDALKHVPEEQAVFSPLAEERFRIAMARQ